MGGGRAPPPPPPPERDSRREEIRGCVRRGTRAGGWAQPPRRSELQPRGSAAPEGAGRAGRCPPAARSSLLLLRLFILFCVPPPTPPSTPGRGEDELAAAESPQAGWVLAPSFISSFFFIFRLVWGLLAADFGLGPPQGLRTPSGAGGALSLIPLFPLFSLSLSQPFLPSFPLVSFRDPTPEGPITRSGGTPLLSYGYVGEKGIPPPPGLCRCRGFAGGLREGRRRRPEGIRLCGMGRRTRRQIVPKTCAEGLGGVSAACLFPASRVERLRCFAVGARARSGLSGAPEPSVAGEGTGDAAHPPCPAPGLSSPEFCAVPPVFRLKSHVRGRLG